MFPIQARPVSRANAQGERRAHGVVAQSCNPFTCAAAVARCVFKCRTNISCYPGCLGSVYQSCCGCVEHAVGISLPGCN